MKLEDQLVIIKHILIALFMMWNSNTDAQGLEFGAGVGGILYWGDLSPYDPVENLKIVRPGGEVFLRHMFTERIAVRANFLAGRLMGDDQYSSNEALKARNLSFFSNVYEFSLIGEFDFLKFHFLNKYNGLKFYIMGGAGLTRFNPRTTYEGLTYELQPLGTEGQGLPGYDDRYGLTTLIFPMGGGMKWRLTDKLTLNPEISFRLTLTDHLDDVSGGYYVNYYELRDGNGEIAAMLANRQNEAKGITEPLIYNSGVNRRGGPSKDFYFTGMIRLTYRFNDQFRIFEEKSRFDMDCPEF